MSSNPQLKTERSAYITQKRQTVNKCLLMEKIRHNYVLTERTEPKSDQALDPAANQQETLRSKELHPEVRTAGASGQTPQVCNRQTVGRERSGGGEARELQIKGHLRTHEHF